MDTGILIADQDTAVRESIAAFLRCLGFSVIGLVQDMREAVALSRQLRPRIVVFDSFMPTAIGLEVAASIRVDCPATRMIAMTMHMEAPYVHAALRAGIAGYVIKTRLVTFLVPAIQAVARGAIYLCPEIATAAVRAWLSSVYAREGFRSSKEHRAAQLMAEGQTVEQIAALLDISVKAAAAYRSRIIRRLQRSALIS